MTPLVHDADGRPIEVDSMVVCGDGEPGRVTKITESDGDADAEGRPYGISPRVRVLWPEAEDEDDVEEFIAFSSARGPGEDDEPWVTYDLQIANER